MEDMTIVQTENKDFGGLPIWSLEDLYSGPEGKDLKAAFAEAEGRIDSFQRSYNGKLDDLSAKAFGEAIVEYEAIGDLIGRIGSFAQLYHSQNVSDPERSRFYQNIIDHMTTLSSKSVFFTLEINQLDDSTLEAKLSDPIAAKYRPWLRDLRVYKNHELGEELERLLHEKSVSGRAAWVRLFDQTEAAIRCEVEGQKLTLTEALNGLSDGQPEKRRVAAKGISKALSEKASLFAYITNVLAKDKATEDEWRKYEYPVSARNLANLVEDEVVDALIAAVRESYVHTSHRYYALKAKWLGKDNLDYWDRNAPLPNSENMLISWEDAKTTVLDAYGGFSPSMADTAKFFLREVGSMRQHRQGKPPAHFLIRRYPPRIHIFF